MDVSSRGSLFVVATPIGNLDDISARALATLRAAALILCEDTRVSSRLLERHGITARLTALHEHNEKRRIAQVLHKLEEGCAIALISDAGTPTVSDPGRWLIAAAHAAGAEVISVPGPNAAVAALAGCGMEADRFVFEGFLPSRRGARRARLEALQDETRTLVFYEAPHRIAAMVEDLASVFGAERGACLAKELTKVHERLVCDSLGRIGQWLAGDDKRRKGEFVVVVEGGAPAEGGELKITDTALLAALLEHLPARTAAGIVSQLGGGKRNRLYQTALELTSKQ